MGAEVQGTSAAASNSHTNIPMRTQQLYCHWVTYCCGTFHHRPAMSQSTHQGQPRKARGRRQAADGVSLVHRDNEKQRGAAHRMKRSIIVPAVLQQPYTARLWLADPKVMIVVLANASPVSLAQVERTFSARLYCHHQLRQPTLRKQQQSWLLSDSMNIHTCGLIQQPLAGHVGTCAGRRAKNWVSVLTHACSHRLPPPSRRHFVFLEHLLH